jgi:hypothetical protein
VKTDALQRHRRTPEVGRRRAVEGCAAAGRWGDSRTPSAQHDTPGLA